MNESASLVDDLPSAAIDPIVPVGCEQRVSDTLPVAVKRIAEELDPDRIILFGSFAHGTATPLRQRCRPVGYHGDRRDQPGALLVCLSTADPASFSG